MTTELPSRPSPDPHENQIVSATDRVKSVADKTDPRFEAALQRADKEARIRARREARDAAEAGVAGADAEEANDAEANDEGENSESFSFNMTDRDGEDAK